MMKKMMQRGFTLIELLVVIAIIGILAAVVLTSLNDARDNANDASAKQSMASIRSSAEIFYNENGFSYTGLCAAPAITTLETAAEAQTGTTFDCDVSAAPGAAYAVTIPLRSGRHFCVDSTGKSGENTTAKSATATACP